MKSGLDYFDKVYRRPDGFYGALATSEGQLIDDGFDLYNQAFAILAFCYTAKAIPGLASEMSGRALALLRNLRAEYAHREAGFQEACPERLPLCSNPHMHLFEACLAWEAVEPGREWTAMADAIAGLARRHFIDADGGFLREFFAPDWRPAAGEAGSLVEPGHQFEWAWLLTRWGRARGDDWAAAAAERLYEAGSRGIDAARGVAVDELDDQLNLRSGRARLWPQTERLKAALILGDRVPAGHAAEALKGLQLYLEPTGLWRDKLEPDGRFVEEPAPASSLYHITAAWVQLRESLGATGAGRT